MNDKQVQTNNNSIEVIKKEFEMKLQIDITKETNLRLDVLIDHIQENRLAAPTHKQRLAGDILAAALPEWEKEYGVENKVFGPEKMLHMIECIDHHKQNGASGVVVYQNGWKIYYDGGKQNMGRLDRRDKIGDPDKMTDEQATELMREEQEIARKTKPTKSIAYYPTQVHFDNITPGEGLAIAKAAQRFSDAKQIEKMTPNDPYFADHWMYGVHWAKTGSAFGCYPDAE